MKIWMIQSDNVCDIPVPGSFQACSSCTESCMLSNLNCFSVSTNSFRGDEKIWGTHSKSMVKLNIGIKLTRQQTQILVNLT